MLHYRTHLQSPDREWVVLVHGAGGSSSVWFRQLRAYREEFNVLLVDLRGHGDSAHVRFDDDDHPYTFERVSRDVLEVLDHVGIERAHFVGISLGCLIIRTIADMAPHRVLSMVLGGAIGRLKLRSRVLVHIGNAVKHVIPFMWLYRLYAWILMPRARNRESRNIFVREAQRIAQQEFLRWFALTLHLTPVLRSFEERDTGIPTLYLMGEDDHMFLPPARRLAEAHESAMLRVVERSGHVCNIERPHVFNRESITFMKGPLKSLRAARALLLFSVLGMPAAASAQVTQPTADAIAQMNTRIQAELTSQNIPGVAVAVASRGRLLHVGTFGQANVELRVPVTDSTVFEIGSISKQFVAAAALLLVQDGRLGLDDPIHRHLTNLPGEWLGVTVRQLLNHTSGIPDYEEIQTYEAYRFRFTPDEIIRVAHSRPMDFEPGQGWYYSNTGYFLLSMIVERIEGRPLNDVMVDRIFRPLGMLQTRMADPEDIIPHRASGYWVDRMGVKLMNRDATQASSTLGAGGLLSSVHDLAKWDAALYGSTLLSEATKAAMWTPAVLPNGTNTNYGFGWTLAPYRGRRTTAHTGQVAGFVTSFTRLPDDELAVIVLTNRYRINAGRIREAVADAFIPAAAPARMP